MLATHRTELSRPAIIMVVDDNRGDMILTSRAINRSEVATRLMTADSAEMALDMLLRKGEYGDLPLPDLILLDLNLPRLSGLDLLGLIKANAALCHIPVIILSSSEAEQDITGSYQRHAAGYVVKPGTLEHFRQFVDALTDFFLKLARLAGQAPFTLRPA